MKVLLIRFSSFGDVTQCLSVPAALRRKFPGAEVHWVVRSEFTPLMQGHPDIAKVWGYSRSEGLKGLWRLAGLLRRERFTHVYDAHNNLRSRIICARLTVDWPWRSRPVLLRRSLRRWKRFLLFRLRINRFQQPFSGQRDLLEPLSPWGIPSEPSPSAPQIHLDPDDHRQADRVLADWHDSPFWCLAPSAAHQLKRWPVTHWQELIRQRKQNRFVLLGGPEDAFLADIRTIAPERVLNLAGLCDFRTSAAVIARSQGLVSNDTGPLHLAEQLGHRCLALMGPAPFGFPCRPSTHVLELFLPCRPCSKHGQGPCRNKELQKCLVDIRPEHVSRAMDQWRQGVFRD